MATNPTPSTSGGSKRKRVDDDDAAVAAPNEAALRRRQEADRVAKLSGTDLDRYEASKRTLIAKPPMKRLLQAVTGLVPDAHAVIVMCGVAKLLVADVVRKAREIEASQGGGGSPGDGPIDPATLRLAHAALASESESDLALRSRPQKLFM